MESFGLSYADIMAIPTTRRYRLIQKKVELEQKRQEEAKKAESAARTRRR